MKSYTFGALPGNGDDAMRHKGAGRFLTLPWWRWWGKSEQSPAALVEKGTVSPPCRWVVEVENGWHSELQDVPLFVQRFVMAMEAQEDSDVTPTVEWWEIFLDPEDPALGEAFRRLLTGDLPPVSEQPAFQSARITTREPDGKHQREESIAYFSVTGQGTRYFVGHIPDTHAWVWGCCLWAEKETNPTK